MRAFLLAIIIIVIASCVEEYASPPPPEPSPPIDQPPADPLPTPDPAPDDDPRPSFTLDKLPCDDCSQEIIDAYDAYRSAAVEYERVMWTWHEDNPCMNDCGARRRNASEELQRAAIGVRDAVWG